MRLPGITETTRHSQRKAFTLAEVVVALAVGGLIIWGLLVGFISSSERAEWTAYSLAAQSLANQGIEQTRAAKWEPNSGTLNQLIDATDKPSPPLLMDLPYASTNWVMATNYTTIASVPGSSAPLKMIRVDCVWTFGARGPFTNTMVTYRAPDQL